LSLSSKKKIYHKGATQMEKEIKAEVRKAYGEIARQGGSCCGSGSSCCGGTKNNQSISTMVGYTEAELGTVPEGSDLGLGCGNPVALASLKEGEVVLDLGSGPGLDCFLAANGVGESGRVIGVDMTPDMLDRARQNAQKGNYSNVEFRLGEIENLPVADNCVDVVISNCVINLCPDKGRVFSEIHRVLKTGGRLMVSDIVLEKDLPHSIKNSTEAYCGCIAGAALKNEYLNTIQAAGFHDVTVVAESTSYIQPGDYQPEGECKGQECCCNSAEDDVPVISLKVSAVKPV
jgi:arsenite methyltransferase